MKTNIKRKVRIKENTFLKEYSGFIFCSNKILPNENQNKLIKLNVTKFFTKNNSNNFFLENKYIDKNIDSFIQDKFCIPKNNILDINIIFKKEKKIIYLIYLKFETTFLHNYTLINMYTFKNLEKKKDLYHCIYSKSKMKFMENYKILYDEKNYLSINLKNIYYYLIGNDHSNIDLNKYINI